jgi:hypothetical protein
VTPAGACPTITDPQGLTDKGTISGPTGTYRVCELPNLIKVSSTLPKIDGLLYSINGRVNVGCDGGFRAPSAGSPFTSTTVGCTTPLTADTNVTLTIAPGVILFGNTGQSWLAVNRGNKINAVGTPTAPIIFTSKDNVVGFASDSSIGQWGGVVLLGRGYVTDCDATGGGTATGIAGTHTCQRTTEGSVDPALFGGVDDAYNAGTMRYIQIRYSGFVLGADKELQALTLEGIGSGTTIDHFQSHNSSDDGMEVFGGNPNIKYYVATGADDDSLDVDTGARLDVQYALLLQRLGQGDALMEIDSGGQEAALPRTNLKVVNFVGVQPQVSANNEGSGDKASTLFRGNSDTTLANGLIVSPNNECIRMTGSGTTPATLTARSVALTCNAGKFLGDGSYTAANVQTMFNAGTNNNDALASTLTGFVNGANENAIVPFDASTLSAFFDVPSPNHAGAAWTGNTTWYTTWTCNSSYASLGGGSACTSLPTT